jgi:hypothetical protein
VSQLNVNKTVDNYIKLRDRKRELEAAAKEQVAPFIKLMGEIETQLLAYMQQTGVDSVATPGGTAYQSTVPRATIKDGAAFREWVINNDEFDLVDWKANPRAVQEYIANSRGQTPPGVNASTFTTVRFRRPGEEE